MTPEDLARKGYYLFPCKGKTPLVKWSKRSTTDIPTIQRWKAQHPGCSWGIDCGKSGLFVIDDDRGKNPEAAANLDWLETMYDSLPETFTVRTKSGGYHYYFKGAGRNSAGTKLGPGLDTRGKGGFVVAPCSEGYEVVKDLPVADVPSWVIDLVGTPIEKAERTNPADLNLDTPAALLRASGYLLDAAPAIEGQYGDDRTYQVACQVRDFGVSEDKCLELMTHWNEACQPPWDTEELEVKVANAYSYAANELGALSADTVFAKFVEPEGEPRFKLLRSADIKNLPPLQWRVKGLITTRGLFQVYGVTGSGKSFLMIEMLAAIAEGRDWFGYKTKPTTVLYICLEGEQGLKNRIEAWEKYHGRTLPDNFVAMAQPWSIIKKQDILDLAKLVPKDSVIVIDTQNRAAPGINESASEDMGALLEGAKLLERSIEGAVGLIAHPGKDLSRGSRGHSSQIPTMDAVLEVAKVDGKVRKWSAVKVKDGRDGQSALFGLKVVDLYLDEDGDMVTSCVIDYEVVKGVDTDGWDLTENEGKAWQAIKFLASESRDGAVATSAWQKELAEQTGEKNNKNFKNQFYKTRDGLVEKGLVMKQKGMYVICALNDGGTES